MGVANQTPGPGRAYVSSGTAAKSPKRGKFGVAADGGGVGGDACSEVFDGAGPEGLWQPATAVAIRSAAHTVLLSCRTMPSVFAVPAASRRQNSGIAGIGGPEWIT